MSGEAGQGLVLAGASCCRLIAERVRGRWSVGEEAREESPARFFGPLFRKKRSSSSKWVLLNWLPLVPLTGSSFVRRKFDHYDCL
ncbi:hypothetical protein KQX54_007833 [Cotesia glomerata]|uniref:Secreted protein n=1 Tax=Cotesia glomerata TaxID=32391 RepID=A0AAV7IQW2_COTGL|nr:hypothetical protein KQX54_007833 [Cotesia glomerata]